MSLILGRGNICFAITSATFAELGFDSSNVYWIFEVEEALKSWKPGRTINAINGITAGKRYWLVPKIDFSIPELAFEIQEAILEGTGTIIVYP